MVTYSTWINKWIMDKVDYDVTIVQILGVAFISQKSQTCLTHAQFYITSHNSCLGTTGEL